MRNRHQFSNALILAAVFLVLTGCSINVKKDNENGHDKNVDIDTPFGGIHVSKGADVHARQLTSTCPRNQARYRAASQMSAGRKRALASPATQDARASGRAPDRAYARTAATSDRLPQRPRPSPDMPPEAGRPAIPRSGVLCVERATIVVAGPGNVRRAEGKLPFDGPPRDEIVRVARHASGGNRWLQRHFAVKGNRHRAGDSLVTISRSHPHGHRWPAVEYLTET